MTTTTGTRTLSAGERVREIKWLLRRHGLFTLGGGPYRNGTDQPLGGPRGIHVQAAHSGADFTAYHPHPAIRLELLGQASAALRAEGWDVTPMTRRGEPGPDALAAPIEVFLFAQPTRPDYWQR